jgi:hypothetical protein
MFRLSSLTYLVCGLVLIAITWAGFYFLSIQKTKSEIEGWKKYASDLRQVASDPEQKAAQKRVMDALKIVQDAEIEWKKVAETKTPAAGRMNLTRHRWQSTVDVRQWHAQVERDLRAWILSSGVKIIATVPQDVADGARAMAQLVYANAGGNSTAMDNIFTRDRLYWENRYRMIHNIPNDEIRVPFPTDLPNELVQFYFNYPALPFPVAFLPAGQVTVESTYNRLMEHVRSWNDIPGYIASVRGVSIEGTGPTLRATYDLFVVAYINSEYVFGGSSQTPFRIPDISSASQTGGPGQGGGAGSGTSERPTPGGGGGGGATAGGGAQAPAGGAGGRGGPTIGGMTPGG